MADTLGSTSASQVVPPPGSEADMTRARWLLLLALVLSASAAGEENRVWTDAFCSTLVALPTLAAQTATKDLALGGLEQRMEICREPEALAVLLALWQKDVDVEVYWWRETRRGVRALAVALELCATSDILPPVEGTPAFQGYAERFAAPERTQRLEEIEYVKAHRAAIAKVLVAAYDACGQKPRGYGPYKRAAGNAANQSTCGPP